MLAWSPVYEGTGDLSEALTVENERLACVEKCPFDWLALDWKLAKHW